MKVRETLLAIFLSSVTLLFTSASSSLGTTFFTDDYSDSSLVQESSGLVIGGGTVTLLPQVSINEGDTLFLTSLDDVASITTPQIGNGGGISPSGVSFGPGKSGQAVYFENDGYVYFPMEGNIQPSAGSIDFFIKLYDWYTPGDVEVFFYQDEVFGICIYKRSHRPGTLAFEMCDFAEGHCNSIQTDTSFENNVWYQITFTWNALGGDFCVHVDGVLNNEQEVEPLRLPSSVIDFRKSTLKLWPWSPEIETLRLRDAYSLHDSTNIRAQEADLGIFWLGGWPLGPMYGALDEFRIMQTEFGTTAYPRTTRILESVAFDTGVAEPVWGPISWEEALSDKTDIQIQTSVSADRETYTAWNDKAIVTFSFDDGTRGQVDYAYPLMKSYGFPGTLYLMVESVTNGLLNLEEITDMQNEGGWEIGGHSISHPNLALLEQEELFYEVGGNKAFLEDHDLHGSSFAYPYGSYNQNVIDVVSDFFASGRMACIPNDYQTLNHKYNISMVDAGGTTPLSDVLDAIDVAVANRGWVLFMLHGITQDGVGGGWDPRDIEDFDVILSYLRTYVEQDEARVLTTEQALSELTYSESSGELIRSENRRYIRYRAMLNSYSGTSTPELTGIRIEAPRKIYMDRATTILENGVHDHETWPTIHDVPIEMEVHVIGAEARIEVASWDESDVSYRRWTETRSDMSGTVEYGIGALAPQGSYEVRVNDQPVANYVADQNGRLLFSHTGETITSEIEVRYVDPAWAPQPMAIVQTTERKGENVVDSINKWQCFWLFSALLLILGLIVKMGRVK
jgi:peptidoglycan/xylan/chitin deacetylase (PgdA/CDA1 family)